MNQITIDVQTGERTVSTISRKDLAELKRQGEVGKAEVRKAMLAQADTPQMLAIFAAMSKLTGKPAKEARAAYLEAVGADK